ncbi:cytoplasmic protein [Desulfonema ishimotonii]|uniref:Cytoplasmic protein n=1 Tax=Desulfonema ishimotonii TaxID=45657 RepID=A0A401FTC6_9BACT|nr:cytoplasmic protein [Desulfonema ishimotonii]GBC60215.1 cytoplasmic protein [Desulfonema ishimotonii]
MLKKDIIRRNPLRLMGYEAEDILGKGEFGALTARAGVGKTAFVVQLALDKLLRDKNILHISIDEPVDKVCLWYEEAFRNIASQCDIKQLEPFWEAILPKRLVMTFKVDGFSVPKLEERIADLTAQNIFFPQTLIVDGLPFDEMEEIAATLNDLKRMAEAQDLSVWFTVRTHRHESPGPDGMPIPLTGIADLFKTILELQPDGKDIQIKAIKGGPEGAGSPTLILDPSTMLVKSKSGSGEK